MKVLKKVDLLSAANVLGLMGVVWGLITAVLAVILSGIIGTTASILPGAEAAIGVGILSVVILPITYGIVGFVAGVVTALIYNLVSKWIGGIKLDIK